MEQLLSAVRIVFPNFVAPAPGTDIALAEIPGWDSMNSVSLAMEIEAAFGHRFSDVVLTGDHRLSDVVKLLEDRGIRVNGFPVEGGPAG
jgi:hypothetical protein